jgi:hypothetical protein
MGRLDKDADLERRGMERQQAIDDIAKWMGWHKNTSIYDSFWWWVNAENERTGGSSFDPFTSPNDCNRVMEEVGQKGIGWLTHRRLQVKGNSYWAQLWNGKDDWDAISNTSWMEAFSLAVWELVKHGRGE